MTISTQNRTAGPFAGNGATTVFPFNFKVFAARDVLAVRAETATSISTTLALTQDYTVTLNGDQDADPGGSVNLLAPLAAGFTLVLTSQVEYLQPVDLTNGGGFYPKVLNGAFDRITILLQQLYSIASRSLRFPVSDTGTNTELPQRTTRANNLLGFDANGNPVAVAPIAQSATALQAQLNQSAGTAMLGFIQAGAGARGRSAQDKLREQVSVTDRTGVTGDGISDDLDGIKRAITALGQRGALVFPPAATYKISDTIEIFGKAGAVVDFGNQQINAGSFTTPKPALHFKSMSQAVIDNIFVIGSLTNTNTGVLFDAADGAITIHVKVGKVHASNCAIGIQVGAETYQVSDSTFEDLYGADCGTGIVFTGENTLAMRYGRVAAYNNSDIGVHFAEGGGAVDSLQVAASNNDLYFGNTSGMNQNRLERWDILSGYSEQGVDGEVWINSAACADTHPFEDQIVISGYRVTPFTSTNVLNFIQWRLNGDLILRDCSIAHGQQEPRILVEHNTAYRAPRVVLEDCVIDCNPDGLPQVPMSYALTENRQSVEINARVNNGITVWQNDGAVNEGVIKSGIYMAKRKLFEGALLGIAGLRGAWGLADITAGSCRNLVLGGSSLEVSAPLQRRDFWLDDGLIGFNRNAGTTSKTASTTSDLFVAQEYTFGCFLRTGTSGVDETEYTALGGAGGIRLGIGDTGGAFVRVQVGAFNIQAVPTYPFDPHLVIGRYVPGTSVQMNAINLRTGELISAAAGGPALVDVTWVNGVSIRNDSTVRGFPFVFGRALSNNEISQLLQTALRLTDSWRNA